MVREAYVQAGYAYARSRAVEDDAPDDVRALVDHLRALDCVDDVCAACRPRAHPPLLSFVVYGVIDPLLVDLHRDISPLTASDALSDLLGVVFDDADERDVEHVACGVASVLVSATAWRRAEDEDVRLRLMERVSRLPQSDMVRDADLVCALSRCARHHPTLFRIVTNARWYLDARLVDDLLRRCVTHLSRPPRPDAARLGFAETCLRHNPRCRDAVVEETVELWRTGWHPALGELVALQLDTSSVEFVVRLEQKGKLCYLIRACDAHLREHLTWRVARGHLRRQWSERVLEVLQEAPDEIAPTCDAECPITHAPMRCPVVASDGHTYERDALLRHMVRSGAWSPLTREPISYHVYANRALQ